MSKETYNWLNRNTLIGFTNKRGKAWHHRGCLQTIDPITGHIGNHYPEAIPLDHVQRRLFSWKAESCPLTITLSNPDYDPELPETDGNRPELHLPVEDGRQAIVRTDTRVVFGIFKEGYQIHQYQDWLLENVETILDADLQIGSAGLLAQGAKAWVSVEVPENIVTPEGVEFRPSLLATTSHDGTIATTYKRVVQLVVCDNTLDIARREKGQEFKIRHSKNSLGKIGNARDALNLIYQDADDFTAEVKALTSTPVTDKQWSEFLDAHIPVPEEKGSKATRAENKREVFTGLWNADPRVTPWKNTAFGVLQAGNTYFTHLASVRRMENSARIERTMQNILAGKTGENDSLVLADLNKVLARA